MNAYRISWVLVAALQLNACTSFNTVPYTRGLGELPPLRTGDVVTLHTRTDTHRLAVSRLTPEQVCDKRQCIRIDQIESIERLEIGAGATAGAVLLSFIVGGIMVGRKGERGNSSPLVSCSLAVCK